MKFNEQSEPCTGINWRKFKKNGFEFKYTQKDNIWFCVISYTKKDMRFDTIFTRLTLNTEQEVQKWCEDWSYKKYTWLLKNQESGYNDCFGEIKKI